MMKQMPKTENKDAVVTPSIEQISPTWVSKAKPLLPWALVAIVVIGAGVFSALQYKRTQSLNKEVLSLKANPQQAAAEQTKALVDKVGQLIVLPQDEQPTIATVTDLKPLKDQPFFAKAEIGDRVLIYTNAKQAILYSEKLNKIKEVAPVNLGNNTTTPAPQVAGDTTTTPSKKK